MLNRRFVISSEYEKLVDFQVATLGRYDVKEGSDIHE